MRHLMIAIFVALVLPLTGCDSGPPEPPKPTKAEILLDGIHQLRKMSERTEVNSRISGGFFLVLGTLEGKSKTTISVKFAWQMNDGTYAISSLPLEKIRVRLDEKIAAPTIEFNRWRRCDVWCAENGLQPLIDDSVEYAVITVKENDWPIQVDLPLNDS